MSQHLNQISIPADLWEKTEQIRGIFHEKTVIVAFSGGIDSTLLSFLAREYAKKVLVVLIKAPTTPHQEYLQAQEFSSQLSLPLEILEEDTLKIPEIAQNIESHCYYCKQKILDALLKLAEKKQYDLVVDGTNFSDLSATRPGLKALDEVPVRSPLAEAKLSKSEIIQLSQLLDLPSKNIPSQACLASRVPFNVALTPQILTQIDQSEQYIRKIVDNHTSPLRVRLHVLSPTDHFLARIECDEIIHRQILEGSFGNQIDIQLKQYGFTYVTVDLHGFQSGSMHKMV